MSPLAQVWLLFFSLPRKWEIRKPSHSQWWMVTRNCFLPLSQANPCEEWLSCSSHQGLASISSSTECALDCELVLLDQQNAAEMTCGTLTWGLKGHAATSVTVLDYHGLTGQGRPLRIRDEERKEAMQSPSQASTSKCQKYQCHRVCWSSPRGPTALLSLWEWPGPAHQPRNRVWTK